jgi:hypothetical protein
MAATLDLILDGIEALLQTVPNLRTRDVVGPDLPVSGQASAAVVMTPNIPSYRATMGRGKYESDIDVLVLTSKLVDRVGQRKLARFASQTGETSIRAAIEADPTLGGTVDTSYVASFENLEIEQVGVIGYFGGMFRIHFVASGE